MDDKPDAKPEAPADPFHPAHVGFVAMIEMLHNFRNAGGGLIESAVLVAAILAVNGAGGEQQDES